MKGLLVVAGLSVLGLMCWRIAGALATDAAGMAVGMVFGVLAGVPAALLVLATSSRRRELEQDEDERYERYHSEPEPQIPAYPYQPPVIVGPEPEPVAQQQPPAPMVQDRYERFAHLELDEEVRP